MPYKVAKRGAKYRIVKANTGAIATNSGHAVDGGGMKSKAAATKKVTAMNIKGGY